MLYPGGALYQKLRGETPCGRIRSAVATSSLQFGWRRDFIWQASGKQYTQILKGLKYKANSFGVNMLKKGGGTGTTFLRTKLNLLLL